MFRRAIWLFLCLPTYALPCVTYADDDTERTLGAIRQASEQYVAAVNRSDAPSVAAFWTPQGDLVDSNGRSMKGRDLARSIQPAQTPSTGGMRLTIDSVRLINSDVAIEDGRTQWPAAAAGDRALVRYTAVWVRQNGKWLLDSVRECAADPSSHEARLQELGWLLGEWTSAEGGPAIEMTCQWSLDRHFLLREIRTQTPAGPVSVSQRLGWDPATRQIKSWTFDSHGGHGLGTWSREGDRWVVNAAGVLPDGRSATSRNVYLADGADALRWESTESTIDGAAGPIHKVLLLRKAVK